MKFKTIIKKGEKQYVAISKNPDVVSQGYTIQEAKRNINEAVELYLEETK